MGLILQQDPREFHFISHLCRELFDQNFRPIKHKVTQPVQKGVAAVQHTQQAVRRGDQQVAASQQRHLNQTGEHQS